tara:strand:+ start:3555 stop:3782 length:228 start_codon:yes stop_codon:yes gene_type:complete
METLGIETFPESEENRIEIDLTIKSLNDVLEDLKIFLQPKYDSVLTYEDFFEMKKLTKEIYEEINNNLFRIEHKR